MSRVKGNTSDDEINLKLQALAAKGASCLFYQNEPFLVFCRIIFDLALFSYYVGFLSVIRIYIRIYPHYIFITLGSFPSCP